MASAFADLITAHRDELEKLDRSTMRRFARVYVSARRTLRDKLDRLAPGKEWTHAALTATRAELDATIRHMSALLGEELGEGAGRAGRAGWKHFRARYDFMVARSGIGGPIHVPLLRVLSKSSDLLLHRIDTSRRSYGDQVIASVSGALTRGVLMRESPLETVHAVAKAGGILDGEMWRAERITRTEMAYASEKVNYETGAEAVRSGDAPRLKKRLHSPMDDRTADDSYAPNQDGLTVEWSAPFVEPITGRVYDFPPARPNDRATCVPWMDGWPEYAAIEPTPLPS